MAMLPSSSAPRLGLTAPLSCIPRVSASAIQASISWSARETRPGPATSRPCESPCTYTWREGSSTRTTSFASLACGISRSTTASCRTISPIAAAPPSQESDEEDEKIPARTDAPGLLLASGLRSHAVTHEILRAHELGVRARAAHARQHGPQGSGLPRPQHLAGPGLDERSARDPELRTGSR